MEWGFSATVLQVWKPRLRWVACWQLLRQYVGAWGRSGLTLRHMLLASGHVLSVEVPPQRTCSKAKGILRVPEASGCLVPWTDTQVPSHGFLSSAFALFPSISPLNPFSLAYLIFSSFLLPTFLKVAYLYFPLSLLSVPGFSLTSPTCFSSLFSPLCLPSTTPLFH